MRQFAFFAAMLTVVSPLALRADFSYQETTKMTGGMAMAAARFGGSRALQPHVSTVVLRGNRMAHISDRSAQITDLEKDTITMVDFDKKTYSVMTFEEMKKMMQDAMSRMQTQPEHAEMSFKADVKQTGQSKPVNGIDAKEFILTLTMQGTDRQSGQTGNINFTNDMWMAPEFPGYDQVRDFQMRMGRKMGMVLGGNPMAMMRPGMAKGMAQMVEHMSKLKGVPVMQVMRVGSTADGQPLPAASEAPDLASQMPSAGDIMGQAAAGAATNEAASRMGRLGGLAGGIGGIGGFGRKKKPAPQEEQPPQAKPSSAAGMLLMESTTEMTGFSSAAVDPSKLEVPAGFKQVESEFGRGRR